MKLRRPAASWRQLYAQRAESQRQLELAAAAPRFGESGGRRSDYLVGVEVRIGDHQLPLGLLMELDEEPDEVHFDNGNVILSHQFPSEPTVEDIFSEDSDQSAQLTLCLVRKLDGKCLVLVKNGVTNEFFGAKVVQQMFGADDLPKHDGHVCLAPSVVSLQWCDTMMGVSWASFAFGRLYARRCPSPGCRCAFDEQMMDPETGFECTCGIGTGCKLVGVVFELYKEEVEHGKIHSVSELLHSVEHPSSVACWV